MFIKYDASLLNLDKLAFSTKKSLLVFFPVIPIGMPEVTVMCLDCSSVQSCNHCWRPTAMCDNETCKGLVISFITVPLLSQLFLCVLNSSKALAKMSKMG